MAPNQGISCAADKIANGILYLTSSESTYVTGITLAVDGGRAFH